MEGYCTINSDASVRGDKVSFGCKIFTDDYIISAYGPLDCHPDSNVAEMAAVNWAVNYVLENQLQSSIIVINCDNSTVRNAINNGTETDNPLVASQVNRFQELKSHFPKVYAKRIKGHTKLRGGRDFVNRWCDSKASEGRSLTDIVVKVERNLRHSIIVNPEGYSVPIVVGSSRIEVLVKAKSTFEAEQIVVNSIKELFINNLTTWDENLKTK